MDIRKYFSPAGGSKTSKTSSSSKDSKKKNRIIDSDDEDPLPSAKKKQRILASDSDEDIFESPSTKKPKKEEKPKKKSLPKPEAPKLKPTSAADFFGSSPVVRKETQVVAPKKEPKVVEIHSDDDFEKTLLELDEEDKKSKPLSSESKNAMKDLGNGERSPKPQKSSKSLTHVEEKPKPNENSPPKEKDKSSKGGLASKLSAKIKSDEKADRKDKKERSSEVTPKKDKKEGHEKDRSHSHEKKRKHHDDSDRDRKSSSTPDKNDSSHKKQKLSSPKEEKHSSSKDDRRHSGEKKAKEEKGSSSTSKVKIEVEKEKTPKKPKEDKVTPSKKGEHSEVETTPQADEKRKNARASYFKFLQRSGPSNPGSKLIPEGAPNCLQGLVFVVTGVLESLDREETSELVKKYGGKVTTSVSRNTSYLVIGNEPGESKMKKAEQLGTKQISEDDLLELIGSLPGKGEEANTKAKEKTSAASKLKAFEKDSKGSNDGMSSNSSKSSVKVEEDDDVPALQEMRSWSSFKSSSQKSQGGESSQKATSSQSSSTSSPKTLPPSSQDLKDRSGETLMWVDKHKPATIKNIIGQQGEKSHVKKLLSWLHNWKKNQFGGKKLVRPSPWAKDDSGAFFKCALLSGSPGVGKTTTAHLVCKEAGFDFVELNASDARSKRRLEDVVSELLSNKSLSAFAAGKERDNTSDNHALVMDEVDGMSGNEDRGGIQELIGLIKQSKVPIIAMCNDRNHPKIRSLANHCFDLRFNKPRIEQIRGPMMSVCFREGIKIKPDALDQIIVGANQDIRQILHHLSVWSANQKNLSADVTKAEAEKAKKDMKMGPWDVCKKVFTESDHKNMSIYNKSDLFFHDYSIAPLFVQENYPKCVPHVAKGNRRITLEQMAKTAASIADGDLCERAIRSRNAWSLLPVQAMYSSVLPGEYMSGHMAMQIEFPKWLGNNSRRNKFDRLMQEMQMHMRLKISGSKMDVNMDYSESLKNAITRPLVRYGAEGVKDAVEVMNTYNLLREDLDAALELTQWPGTKDPMSAVESKVKAAFTRAYNKEGHATPFAVVNVSKKKKRAAGGDGETYGEEEDVEESEEEEDDISKNAMIKVKTKTGGKKEPAASTSKGKGRGASSSSRGGRGRGKK